VSCVPHSVLEAADVSAVTQLILRERLSRDLGLWEQMRDCFHDDSVVRISWINASGPEFVGRSKEMAERNVQASHRPSPPDPNRAPASPWRLAGFRPLGAGPGLATFDGPKATKGRLPGSVRFANDFKDLA
jgi:hypothetical protein